MPLPRSLRIGAIAFVAVTLVAALVASPPTHDEAAVAASGEGIPVGDIPGWDQILAEDFNRDSGLGRFGSTYRGYSGYDGGLDTSSREGRASGTAGVWNNATTVTTHDGLFDCYLHTEGVTPQICALTPSLDGGYWSGQMYGRYSVRFALDSVPGYKIAWLLWPSSDIWTEGELDFPENDMGDVISGSAHDVRGDPGSVAWFVDTGVASTGWHTATTEWRPGSVTFTLDGQSWTTTDPAAIPTRPMRWALQMETQIAVAAPPVDAAGHAYIDWIAAYSYNPSSEGSGGSSGGEGGASADPAAPAAPVTPPPAVAVRIRWSAVSMLHDLIVRQPVFGLSVIAD